jgi:hypothetical protein
VFVQRLRGTRDADAVVSTRRSLGQRDDELVANAYKAKLLVRAIRDAGHPRWAVSLYRRCLTGLAESGDRELQAAVQAGLAATGGAAPYI